MKQKIEQRLALLRDEMSRNGVTATIIPQTDAHQSEYISDHFQVRRWLSGFTGSAGSLVVTTTEALLWADSRYFIQAANQLDGTSIKLMKDGLPGTPSIVDYLCDHLVKGSTVGVDGMLFSAAETATMRSSFTAHGLKFVTDFDPIDKIWEDRPAIPKGKILVHDIKYAGVGAKAKIARVMENVEQQLADAAFISALDEIAWILNIRSNDVKYNPVATSFLYLDISGKGTLFIDADKLDDSSIAYLKGEGIEVAPYTSVAEFLSALPIDKRVLVELKRNATRLVESLGDRAVAGDSPVAMLKACRNNVQIEGTRAAMQRDGVALVKSFMEIERRLRDGVKTTEMDIADILRHYRSEQPLFFDESFGTIAGYGPHGAIVHYEADEESNAEIRPEGLLLIDSGAQYLDGTTDITRTISLGNPTEQQRRDFTLVMKGHIALGKAIFPTGTTGMQLDVLARQFLWQNGMSYLHGTGHGVGHFLNVHEGPQKIALIFMPAPLTPGMVTSNEPGIYRENIHGIRCENLVLCVPAMTTEFGDFYKFENLTLMPFDRNLFDTSLMTDDEVAWVNQYHREVYDKLSPSLNDDEKAWLADKTQPLVK